MRFRGTNVGCQRSVKHTGRGRKRERRWCSTSGQPGKTWFQRPFFDLVWQMAINQLKNCCYCFKCKTTFTVHLPNIHQIWFGCVCQLPIRFLSKVHCGDKTLWFGSDILDIRVSCPLSSFEDFLSKCVPTSCLSRSPMSILAVNVPLWSHACTDVTEFSCFVCI